MMILVDTSVWIDHLRRGNPALKKLLFDERVACHPLVVGELACGTIKDREYVLALLLALPEAPVAEDHEVLHLVESRRLHGRGLGWIDVHLLASALLLGGGFWTLDARLLRAASALGIQTPSWAR